MVLGDNLSELEWNRIQTENDTVNVILEGENITIEQSFTTATNYPVNVAPHYLAVGDLNGDGKMDLVTANRGSSTINVLLGNGNGGFYSNTAYYTGYDPAFVTLGDFNGDNRLDLALSNLGSSHVSIWSGNGNGTFTTGTSLNASSPYSVVIGDFNSDGKSDLASTGINHDLVSVFLGNGNGTFGTLNTYAVGDSPISLSVGDFNGDGKSDLATANSNSNNISILSGKGDGTFAPMINLNSGGSQTYDIANADFNGDGKTDLVTTNISSNNVSILLNTNNAPIVNGQLIKQGTEFQVNTYTTSDQHNPTVTALNDGGFLVTWMSLGQDGSNYGVYAQRYNASGAAVGTEFRVNTSIANDQRFPTVTALNDGGFLVSWTSTGQDGWDDGIYAQRYNASGAAVGTEFLVNTYIANDQGVSTISALSDGGFVVAWQSFGQDGSASGIYARRYNASGAAVGTEFLVNTYTNSYQELPIVTALNDGAFLVSWTSYTQDGSGWGIYAQRYNASGATVGTEFQINTYPYSEQISPTVTALNDGGFLVSWTSYTQDGSGWGIYARRYNASGATVGTEFQVNTYIANDQLYPTVTALNDGGFLVSWMSLGQDGSSWGIYAQRYNPSGIKVNSEFLVNSYTNSDQSNPTVTTLNDGSLLVTWQSYTQDSSGYGVYAQRYTLDAIGTQTATEDSLFNYQIPANTFIDIDAGDSFTYSATLADGSVLPSWLTFNATNRTFSGTPLNSNVGSITVKVTATDTSNASVSTNFNLVVNNVNDAPTVANTITTTIGTEFQVNTSTTNNQWDSTVTTLADGGFVVAWKWGGPNTNFQGLYGQRYNADGTAFGSEFQIIGNVISDQTQDPKITALNDGGFVVTWTSNFDDIYVKQYNSTGVSSNGDFRVNTTTTNTQSQPNVAPLSDGGFIITWESANQDGSGRGVYAQRYDSSGNAVGSEFLVNSTTTDDQSDPAIALLDNGDIVIAWSSSGGQDGGGTGVYAQRYDSNGNALGSEFQVNTYTVGTQNEPSIASLSDGGFIIAWRNNSDFTAQRYDSNGNAVGSEINAPFTGFTKSGGVVTALKNGGFLFSWYSFVGTDGFEISAQQYDSNGNLVGSVFSVNTETTGDQFLHEATALDDGGVVITWTSRNGQDGDGYGVYAQKYTLAAIANQTATEDNLFNFTFNANAFSDPDFGDSLTYSATLANGSALPSWLTFNANTRTFSGTPLNSNVGTITVKVTATDTSNASVSTNFNLVINNVNDAPIVANTITNQTATEDSLFNYQIPANTFTDIDAGDSLTYSATLADGSALPSWLTFNANTRTFSGTPLNSNVGTITVKVTATDTSNASVSTNFNLVINNVNDAPIVANTITNQTATEDSLFNYQIPANTFTDIDAGDSLTYSATLADGSALPSWLTFNATNRTFSGTPLNSNVGSITVKVTATDTSLASVSTNFNLVVNNVNDVPTVANTINNQTATEDSLFNYQIPANTFTDIDAGDSLTYSATLADGSALPSWLTFNANTRTFSGTPLNSNVGSITVKVTATDTSNGSVSTNFNLLVNNVNDAPTVALPIADQTATKNVAYNFTFNTNVFNDVDGDSLTYTATLANNSPLPSWLIFDSATRTFSGTPTATGSIDIKVTANDGNGGTVSDTFKIDTYPILFTDSGQLLGNTYSEGVALGDLDGDGDLDAFEVNRANGGNVVWLNNNSGIFTKKTGQTYEFDTAFGYAVSLGDIDRDGDLDAFTVAGGLSRVWLNNGSGIFSNSGQSLADGWDVNLADLDGDGDLDAFTVSLFAPSKVLLNNGNGVFTDSGQNIGGTNQKPGIKLGDLDRDGDLDAFIGYSGLPSQVWLNDGSGFFTNSGQIIGNASNYYAYGIDLGDLDGDGDLDAFIANLGGASKVWLNNGSGVFSDSGQSLGSSASFEVSLGDLDGDGDLDAFVANMGANKIWLNNGSGIFTDSGLNLGNYSSRSVSLGDLDGDGDLDAFVVNDSAAPGNANQVFFNRTPHPANVTPTVANPINDLTIKINSAFQFVFAENTFADENYLNESFTDVYIHPFTYTATLANNNSLSTIGLTFNSATRRFSGTPTITGSYEVKVIADDGFGGTVEEIFQLNIVNPTIGTTSNDNMNANAHAEIIDGIEGIDRVNYSGSNAGVTVNLDSGIGSGGHAQGDVLISIERLTGSGYDDNLRGHNGVYNYFYAGNGNDTLTTGTSGGYMSGENGDDTLIGDAGRDRLVGGSGEDYLEGKGERDVLSGGNDNDILIGGADNDYLTGDAGDDRLNGTDSTALGVGEIDLIYGGTGADTFILGDGTNVFYDDGNNSNQGKSDFARIGDYNQSQGDVLQLALNSGFNYYLGSSPNGTVTGTAIFVDNDGVSGLSANDEMIANLEGVTLTSGQIVNGVTAGFTFV